MQDSRKLVDLNLKIMRENLISFENRIKNLELLSYKIAESNWDKFEKLQKKQLIRIAVGMKTLK